MSRGAWSVHPPHRATDYTRHEKSSHHVRAARPACYQLEVLIRGRGVCLGMFAAAALAAAGAARADPAVAEGTPTHVVTQPDWVRRPDAEALTRAYPKRASDDGVEGRALIHCKVTAAGALDPCQVVSESPPGYGFGAAAVRMSHDFKMRPATIDGAPVAGGVVNIPIRFVLPPRPPPFQWRREDVIASLQLLAAAAGLALAAAGVLGFLAAARAADIQSRYSTVEAARQPLWPWACLGVGLALIAALAPSLLHHAGAFATLGVSAGRPH